MEETKASLRHRHHKPSPGIGYSQPPRPIQLAISRERSATILKISLTILVLDLVTATVLEYSSKDVDRYSKYAQLIENNDPIAFKIYNENLKLHDADLKEMLETLRNEELIQRIINSRTGDFYAGMMKYLMHDYPRTRHVNEKKRVVLVSDWNKDSDSEMEDIVEYGEDDYAEPTNWSKLLHCVVRRARRLQKLASHAAKNDYLRDDALQSIESKLNELNRNYKTACDSAKYLYIPLIDSESATLWRKKPEISINSTSNNKQTQKSSAIFSFLIPAICLLSSIPACISWIHADYKAGSVADADFFQLISSASMQLLGIGTSLWPTVVHLELSRVAQILTWALAIGSTSLTVIAVPLYLYAPVPWSVSLLFTGSIIQSLLQLQLIVGISKQKDHQS